MRISGFRNGGKSTPQFVSALFFLGSVNVSSSPSSALIFISLSPVLKSRSNSAPRHTRSASGIQIRAPFVYNSSEDDVVGDDGDDAIFAVVFWRRQL